jgi:hypothetical protein
MIFLLLEALSPYKMALEDAHAKQSKYQENHSVQLWRNAKEKNCNVQQAMPVGRWVICKNGFSH